VLAAGAALGERLAQDAALVRLGVVGAPQDVAVALPDEAGARRHAAVQGVARLLGAGPLAPDAGVPLLVQDETARRALGAPALVEAATVPLQPPVLAVPVPAPAARVRVVSPGLAELGGRVRSLQVGRVRSGGAARRLARRHLVAERVQRPAASRGGVQATRRGEQPRGKSAKRCAPAPPPG
jgi:hypothetical protein